MNIEDGAGGYHASWRDRVHPWRKALEGWWGEEKKLRQKLDPNLKRDLEWGWMLPYLWQLESHTCGRWDYWARTMERGAFVIRCCLINGYLYVPWLVKPFPFLDADQYNAKAAAHISDSMTAQAPPHALAYIAQTEHDEEEQWRFEPIKKRKRKTGVSSSPEPEEVIEQGILF